MTQIIGIFVVGASSTGKTTLCKALERRFEESKIKVFHVSEVARTVMREQKFTRDNVGTLEMQEAILKEQIKHENASIHSIGRVRKESSPEAIVLICDRCAVDPVVYATMNLNPKVVEKLTSTQEFRNAVKRYGGAPLSSGNEFHGEEPLQIKPLVILTDGVEAWREDDGVRSLYNPWEVTAVFEKKLMELAIPYNKIGDNILNINERVDWVMRLAGLGHLSKGQLVRL